MNLLNYTLIIIISISITIIISIMIIKYSMKKDLFRKDQEETCGLLSTDHVDSDNRDDLKIIMHEDD